MKNLCPRSKHNLKPQRLVFIIITSIFLFLTGCGTSIVYYSIFDTAPCVEYNIGTGPNVIGTKQGFSIGMSGKYLSMMADTVETVHATGGGVSMFRWRLNARSEIGMTLGACELSGREEYDGTHLYLVCDGKICFINTSVIITINPGFGIGSAEAGYGMDFRCACLFGKSLLYGIFVPYIGPRMIGLRYIWRRVLQGPGLYSETDLALTWMYGITAGVDFNAYSPSKSFQIHLVPEVTVMKGREATLDKINYTIIKSSIMLRLLF